MKSIHYNQKEYFIYMYLKYCYDLSVLRYFLYTFVSWDIIFRKKLFTTVAFCLRWLLGPQNDFCTFFAVHDTFWLVQRKSGRHLSGRLCPWANTEPHVAPGGFMLAPVFGISVRKCVCTGEWDCNCKALWAFKEDSEVLYKFMPFTVNEIRIKSKIINIGSVFLFCVFFSNSALFQPIKNTW